MINFSAVLIQALCVLPLVNSWYNLNFLYEQKNNLHYPAARRHMNQLMKNSRRQGPPVADLSYNFHAHPEPLPTEKPSLLQRRMQVMKIKTPYETVYQGARRPGDRRVFNRRFNHSAEDMPQQVFCEGLFDCVLNHVAVETHGGVPIILRGGAGYRYFLIDVKTKAGNDLEGRVRAYCPEVKEEAKMG